jgi:folate-binding protein YgfZ
VMRARVSLESVDCQGRLLSANILPGRISQRDDVMSDKSGMGWVSSVAPPLAWRLLNSADSEPACMPHDENLARLWQIQAGLPEITGPASGQFIPQMLNLDLLDGVSFRKGCYTGQEIVTRTQHLGRIKRRLVRIAGPGTAPAPGTGVDSAGRGVGQVLTSANDRSGYTALAILQIEAVNTLEHSGPLLTGGVPVKLVPLPYAVPELRARNS